MKVLVGGIECTISDEDYLAWKIELFSYGTGWLYVENGTAKHIPLEEVYNDERPIRLLPYRPDHS